MFSPMVSMLFFLCLLTSVSVFAADQPSTFESFYRSAWSPSYLFAATGALVIGILLYVGLFPITGPVTVIGSSIGSLMGLSGAAATNAGLALVGGGAMVSGGLGVMGGAAVLAAAISFGTDIMIDYASGNVLGRYEQRKFAESSWKMMTLPLPKNTSGPDSVKAAGKALENNSINAVWKCVMQGKPNSIDSFQGCVSDKQKPQRQLLQDSLTILAKSNSTPESSSEDVERKRAMFALLLFINNDYVSAKKVANEAYALGLKSNHTPTLPAFIAAASMLYDEQPDFSKSFEYFQYSIAAEPQNPLTPVLFSTYLDRLSYRLNDGAATLADIERINKFSQTLSDDDRKITTQQILLSHYFMQLKVAQQRVISLTSTQNKTVRENPKTLATVKSSLSDYDQILMECKGLIDRQMALLGLVSRGGTIWGDIKSGKNPFGKKALNRDQGWSESLWTFSKAWAEYSRDQQSLSQRAVIFEKELKDQQEMVGTTTGFEENPMSFLDWVKGILK